MKTIKPLFVYLLLVVLMSSCVYLKHPSSYKLTRGDWMQDTTILRYNELPIIVKDTLASYYENYYNENDLFYPEVISLDQNVTVCFVESVISPFETVIPHTPGYYFRIGSKKYFFDYKKYNTPIVYYENDLYYFSGRYSVKKDRYTFESRSDYENKFFVRYNLKPSHLKKHQKVQKNECSKKSEYSFVHHSVH